MRAEQRHLQLTVLLQLEPAVDRYGLTHGEADFFASVIHTAPLRRRTVAREVGRQISCCLYVRTIDEERHHGDPRNENQERERPSDASRQRYKKNHGPQPIYRLYDASAS